MAARSYRSNEDEVGRDFDRAENYLSLVGLVIVILGGIAISSVTRVFIAQKIRSIAVLKCLGARSNQIMVVYILQVLALGLAGSLLGVFLARTTLAAIPLALGGSTSILAEADYGLSWSAAAQGVAVGLLVSLLFSVVPLMQVRHVKPSLLLRDESTRLERDWARMAVMALVGLALVGVAGWQAGSLRVGAVVCFGFAGLAVVLQAAGRGLIAVIAPLARSPSFPLRHAVLHLSRPGNQTRMILFAVGLGAFFVVGVRSLQASLLAEFSIQISEDAPDMFLLDIQRGQADGVRAFLADPKHGASNSRLMPVLRARVVGVSGRETNLDSFDDVRARGSLAREYTVTYRDHLEANERITRRHLLDRGVARSRGVGRARHPRAVCHQRRRCRAIRYPRADDRGACQQCSRGRLAGRPERRIHVRVPPGRARRCAADLHRPAEGADRCGRPRAGSRHELVGQFPNVSVIDFHEILVTVRDIMSKVTLAITVVGGLVLFSGALILIGAVAMTKFQRVYEAAVLKTLGANTRTIAKMLLFEYGMLGSLAGVVGSLGAVALTWGVSRYALEIPWRIFAGEHIGGVALTAILVAAIGVVSSLDILRHKPLATLRAE